jgi:hypothetical protein
MWRLSDLIKQWANKDEAYDPRETWVNDYPNGFLFLVLMALVLFVVAFVVPFLGL